MAGFLRLIATFVFFTCSFSAFGLCQAPAGGFLLDSSYNSYIPNDICRADADCVYYWDSISLVYVSTGIECGAGSDDSGDGNGNDNGNGDGDGSDDNDDDDDDGVSRVLDGSYYNDDSYEDADVYKYYYDVSNELFNSDYTLYNLNECLNNSVNRFSHSDSEYYLAKIYCMMVFSYDRTQENIESGDGDLSETVNNYYSNAITNNYYGSDGGNGNSGGDSGNGGDNGNGNGNENGDDGSSENYNTYEAALYDAVSQEYNAQGGYFSDNLINEEEIDVRNALGITGSGDSLSSTIPDLLQGLNPNKSGSYGSCINDIEFNIGIQFITLPISRICPWLNTLGIILVFISLFISYQIVSKE